MTENKGATARRSAGSGNGQSTRVGSDIGKVDAHVITRAEYEEAPEVDFVLDAATLKMGSRVVRRGRPRAAVPKQLVTLRLAPGLIEHFRSQGPGWQTRMELILRAAMSADLDEAERASRPADRAAAE